MGFYLNKTSTGERLPACGKADMLIKDGATFIQQPDSFCPDLVCVMSNGPFEAAAFCFSQREFEAFAAPDDPRPKVWLTHPKAAELSGYK